MSLIESRVRKAMAVDASWKESEESDCDWRLGGSYSAESGSYLILSI